MLNKTLIGLLCLLPAGGMAQQPHRIYPAPRLTPEVEQIRRSRTPFRVEAQEDIQLPTSVDNSKTIYFPPIICSISTSEKPWLFNIRLKLFNCSV